MNQEKINFRVNRDFGETFNVSIKFLRQNFKLFFFSLLFISGPFILISSVAGAFYQSSAINAFSWVRSGNPFAQFGLSYFLFIIAAVIAHLALMGTVFSFMLEYMEKGPGNFTVNDVAKRVTTNIGNILSVFFTLTFLICIFLGAFIGILIAIGSSAPVVVGIITILFIIAMLIVFPPIMWQLTVVYLVKMVDNDSVFDSFGRTKYVMKGNFWWTWVIVVCASLAVWIMAMVFALPQAALQLILMFSKQANSGSEISVVFIIVATVCTFCTTLLYAIFYVISAFHYFSLAEQKDGSGLMDRINEIGQTPNNNVDQQY
jgi:hypothetical protein